MYKVTKIFICSIVLVSASSVLGSRQLTPPDLKIVFTSPYCSSETKEQEPVLQQYKEYINIAKQEVYKAAQREALEKLSVIAAGLSVEDQAELKNDFIWDVLLLEPRPLKTLLDNMAPKGNLEPVNGITAAEKIAVLIKNMDEDQLESESGTQWIKDFLIIIEEMSFDAINDHKDRIFANMTIKQLNFIEVIIKKYNLLEGKRELVKELVQKNKELLVLKLVIPALIAQINEQINIQQRALSPVASYLL